MVYNRQSPIRNGSGGSRFFVFFVLAGVVLLLFLQNLGSFKNASNALRGVVNDTITSSDFETQTRLPQNAKDLRLHVIKLEQELRAQNHWRLAAKSLGQKVIAYEGLLNMKNRNPFENIITAKISNSTNGPFAMTILIDAGSRSGVKLNDVVINEAGLVGRVIRVGRVSSRALLLTDFDSRIPVYGSKSNARGVMYGNHGEAGLIRDMPEEIQFIKNEEVYTSGAGGIFPRGLFVGSVTSSRHSPSVRLAMRKSQQGFVQIITSTSIIEPEILTEHIETEPKEEIDAENLNALGNNSDSPPLTALQ